jgi:hypothetical protein
MRHSADRLFANCGICRATSGEAKGARCGSRLAGGPGRLLASWRGGARRLYALRHRIGCVRYSRIVDRSHESDTTMRSTFFVVFADFFLLGFAAPQLLIWLGLWLPRQLGLRALRL